jgi:hypothetical protein
VVMRSEKQLLAKGAGPPRVVDDLRLEVRDHKRSGKHPLHKGLDRFGRLPLRNPLAYRTGIGGISRRNCR